MIIYLWIGKNNDQICNSGLFLQNALVEYIGVYSDTSDVITTTDDVIHIICIDLEGKLMCCLFLGQNFPLQFYFLELHVEMLMQQLLNNNQKICCWSKFLYVKNLFH